MNNKSSLPDELYALRTFDYAFKGIVSIIDTYKSERPDWKDDRNSIGIEVTRAESVRMGLARGTANRHLGDHKSAVAKKRLLNLRRRIHCKNGIITSVLTYYHSTMGNPKHVLPDKSVKNLLLVHSFMKLEKLNDPKFAKFKTNVLCLFAPITCDEDEIRAFLCRYIKKSTVFTCQFNLLVVICFTTVFLIDCTSEKIIKAELSDTDTSKLCLFAKEVASFDDWDKSDVNLVDVLNAHNYPYDL